MGADAPDFAWRVGGMSVACPAVELELAELELVCVVSGCGEWCVGVVSVAPVFWCIFRRLLCRVGCCAMYSAISLKQVMAAVAWCGAMVLPTSESAGRRRCGQKVSASKPMGSVHSSMVGCE